MSRLKKNVQGEIIDEQNTYNPDRLTELFKRALGVLYRNAQSTAQPYFYAQSLSEIIRQVPEYLTVFAFAQYVHMYDLASGTIINELLEEWYGTNYPDSAYLNVEENMKQNSFEIASYKHYIIIDIQRAISLYNQKKKEIDNLLTNIS